MTILYDIVIKVSILIMKYLTPHGAWENTMSKIKYLITDASENALDVVDGKKGVQQMLEKYIQDSGTNLTCFEDFRLFELGLKYIPTFDMVTIE